MIDKPNKLVDLQINTLNKADVDFGTPLLKTLQSMVLSHGEMYPDIEKWFSSKVLSGIRSFTRKAFVGYAGDKPIVSAVLKVNDKSKFCHLHINPGFRNNHIGETLFTLMTLESRHLAKTFHFTLPESLWEEQQEFFKSFGFNNPIRANRQYRLFDEEYYLEAPFNIVWKNSLIKLPKIINNLSGLDSSAKNGVLVSIKPKYIDKIRRNEKSVEIRRKFNRNYKGKKAVLYSSTPSQALCGYATIEDVIEDDPVNIWHEFKCQIGTSEREYYQYTQNCNKIYAIKLGQITLYKDGVYLDQLVSLMSKKLTPPQSYLLLEKNPLWQEAISIAEMLHNRFNNVSSF